MQRLFKGLKDLHLNLKTFKEFKDRYEPCQTILHEYELKSVPKYNNYICKTERFKNSFLPQSIVKIDM